LALDTSRREAAFLDGAVTVVQTFDKLRDNIMNSIPPVKCAFVAPPDECPSSFEGCSGKEEPESHRRRTCSKNINGTSTSAEASTTATTTLKTTTTTTTTTAAATTATTTTTTTTATTTTTTKTPSPQEILQFCGQFGGKFNEVLEQSGTKCSDLTSNLGYELVAKEHIIWPVKGMADKNGVTGNDGDWTPEECAAAVSKDDDCISEYFGFCDMSGRKTPRGQICRCHSRSMIGKTTWEGGGSTPACDYVNPPHWDEWTTYKCVAR